MNSETFFDTAEIPEISEFSSFDVFNGNAKVVFEIVDIDNIYLDPEKTPKKYKTEELAALAMDILKNGLRKPIAVLKISEKDKNFQIVSGEKRFRACLLARVDKIACAVIHISGKANKIYMPPKNYFEKAKLYAEAIDRGIYTEENIAQKCDVDLTEVTSLLSLLVFSEKEQNILLEYCVPEKIAIKLAVMDANTRKGFLETIMHGTNVTAVCAKINEVSAEINGEHFQKTKFRIRGNGFFLNSIDHAVKTMRDGGVNVNYNTCETENETVLTLTIPKK